MGGLGYPGWRSSPSLLSLADSCDKQGESLLGLACSLGLDQAVFLLLQAGAYVDAPGARDSATPLLRAAAAGNANVVKALIAMGADAAAVNAYGEVRTGKKRGTTFVAGTVALICCRFCIFFALCTSYLVALAITFTTEERTSSSSKVQRSSQPTSES